MAADAGMQRRALAASGIVVLALSIVWFRPAGLTPEMAASGALVAGAIGFWAAGIWAEHLVALAFFLLAMLFAVAPAPVVFSGFTSGAFWLVFGGMIIAAAVERTGLGHRLANQMVDRFTGSFLGIISGITLVAVTLSFLMPSTMGRILMLLPVILAFADSLGYEEGSRGRRGMVIATAYASYLPSNTILPANVPNNVLLGAAETFHGHSIRYFDYLLLHFPVLGALKALLVIAVVWFLFNDTPRPVPKTARAAAEKISRDEWRLAILLALALVFWSTDTLHGIAPAWISLSAGMICLLPGINIVPGPLLREKVSINTLLYVAAILGVGATVAHTGLGAELGQRMLDVVELSPDQPGWSYTALAGVSIVLSLFTTMPGIPAIITPMAGDISIASGLPLNTVLMTIVFGYSTVLFPYQTPPLMVFHPLTNVPLRDGIRTSLLTGLVTIAVLIPLDYFWWRFLGYLP